MLLTYYVVSVMIILVSVFQAGLMDWNVNKLLEVTNPFRKFRKAAKEMIAEYLATQTTYLSL